jgi:hypothetical protein
MRSHRTNRRASVAWLATGCLLFGAGSAFAQDPATDGSGPATAAQPADAKTTFEIYGFAMLDIGHDFTQINPNWFDTMRVTKLPSFQDQFGETTPRSPAFGRAVSAFVPRRRPPLLI